MDEFISKFTHGIETRDVTAEQEMNYIKVAWQKEQMLDEFKIHL